MEKLRWEINAVVALRVSDGVDACRGEFRRRIKVFKELFVDRVRERV